MPKYRFLLMLIVVALVSTACGASSGESAKIEFGSPLGKFRVTAPAGWKRTAELLRSTAVSSANGDLMFQVMMIDPPQMTLDLYPNQRKFTSNGREVIVMDQATGMNSTSSFGGHTFLMKDMLNGFVKVGDHSYLVGLQRATTVKPDDAHVKIFADMLGTLEPIG